MAILSKIYLKKGCDIKKMITKLSEIKKKALKTLKEHFNICYRANVKERTKNEED